MLAQARQLSPRLRVRAVAGPEHTDALPPRQRMRAAIYKDFAPYPIGMAQVPTASAKERRAGRLRACLSRAGGRPRLETGNDFTKNSNFRPGLLL